MLDVTQLLSRIETGDLAAAAQLMPLVYDELRKLAAAKLAHEKPGQTLQPTALVHEAYMRLTDQKDRQRWENRGHFFAAAAEAMRRILVETARRKQSIKGGGWMKRHDSFPADLLFAPQGEPFEVLAIHESLDMLARKSPRKAELVKLRYFLGCTMAETAEILGIAQSTAEEDWTYARAWLRRRMLQDGER